MRAAEICALAEENALTHTKTANHINVLASASFLVYGLKVMVGVHSF